MRQRISRVLSQEEHRQFWRELDARSLTPELDERSSSERDRIEADIGVALEAFGTEGWDFRSDHYGPPAYVCRFTLMNRQLHRLDVFQAMLKAFDHFGDPWVLDLGLVDGIDGGVMTQSKDVGRIIITQTEVLLDGELGMGSIPIEFLP